MARTPPKIHMEIVLFALEGDVDPGSVHRVPTGEPLPIGRSSRGLKLLDPLVSIQHAQITLDRHRGYIIEDLGSATGTWVDEECIRGDSRPIGVGTMLRFGDSVFEVSPLRREYPWVRIGVMMMLATVAFTLVLFVFFQSADPPTLELPDTRYVGLVAVDSLDVPEAFLRTRGLSIRDLSIREVSDYDDDHIPEIWLRLGDQGMAVVTFESDGTSPPPWRIIGDLPPGCVSDGGSPRQFPTMRCGGTLWMKGASGYELMQQDGIVVYYRAPSGPGRWPFPGEPDGEAPLQDNGGAMTHEAASDTLSVARMVFRNPSHFAGFLVDRGMTGPVHYLICEDAFEDIAAQVRRIDGGSQLLNDAIHSAGKACLHELRLEGLIEGDPVAIALSPSGHRALIDDVITFYAGSPDGLFLPEDKRELVGWLEADPGFLKGGSKVVADSNDPNGQPFDPIPSMREALPDAVARPLIPAVGADGAAPPAFTLLLLEEGFQTLEGLPGCGDPLIEVGEWRATRITTLNPFASFLKITDLGCGAVPIEAINTGYDIIGSGIYDAVIGDVDLRAKVEFRNFAGGTEAVRARIGYREP